MTKQCHTHSLGAGGTEACDWVSMLLRIMCGQKRNKVETPDYLQEMKQGLNPLPLKSMEKCLWEFKV